MWRSCNKRSERRQNGSAPIWSRIFVIPVFALGMLSVSIECRAKDLPKPEPKLRIDADGRKFVGKIPYDVFFDQPLEIIASGKSIKASPPENPTASQPTVSENSNGPKPAASTASVTWNELITIAELQNEIKTIRNHLAKSVSNQGQYNQHFRSIAIEGAVMASLGEIARQHLDSLSWKDKAAYVREFGHQINIAATGLGKENFENTKSAFQRLTTALDGSIPADGESVQESVPLQDVIPRKGLMKRIESGRDWLKQEVITESSFKSRTDQIRHEAAIIAALTTVLTSTDYEYAENDDYQQHAKSLIEAAKAVNSSVEAESYDRFKQALDQINKSCTDCHASYGNG